MNHDARGAIADQAPVARRAGVPARTKSTAARKDVRTDTHEPEQGTASSGDFQREPASVPLVSDPPRDADAQRSTEGPNSRAKATRAKRPAAKKAAGDGVASRPRPGRAGAPAAKKAVKALRDKGDIIPAEAVKRGRGRPKTVEDRKAYKAQKERERRAKKKPIEASK